MEETRLKRDLALAEDPSGAILVTPTGDMPTVAGRENLRAAVRRRVFTQPGELLHRPDYGAGLPGYVERMGTAATRARLATDIRRNMLRDRRVAECRATVSLGLPGLPARADAVTVDLAETGRGDDAAEQMTLQYAE